MDNLKLIFAGLLVAAAVFLYYQFDQWPQVARVGAVLAGAALAVAVAATTAPGRAAWVFAKGANIERQRMVWPARREAMQVTGLVVVMVILFGLYLWLLDTLSFFGIYDIILGLG